MVNINFNLEDDLAQRLDQRVKATGRSRDEFLAEMVRRNLTIEDIDRLRKKFVPRAEKLGVRTDQDVFDQVS
ncbi:MAG: ribbon-helix-helix protein, CopG family [Nitrospinaceae bacterium]